MKAGVAGFFLGQQVTFVVAPGRTAYRAGHANVVALGGTAFKAEHTVTRLVTEHGYADESVSWVRGWVDLDDTEALVATRALVGSFEL